MTVSAANTLWARSFVDELARNGVREVVVAPGSRSTPLVLALARDGRFRMRVHLDERSASYFALGAAKASGVPVVVVTTSGTAVANVFPAVVEACQSGVPLIVLTADRPPRLRDSDANQAIDQVGIFGRYVRAFFDVSPPTLDARSVRHLRALANRAYAAAVRPDAGPVHVNFPFDKPLEPGEVDAGFIAAHAVAATGRGDEQPFVQVQTGLLSVSRHALSELWNAADVARGVLVAGPSEDATRVGPAAVRLAATTGFPLLADPLSGARYGATGGAHVVSGYDLFLRETAVLERLAPSVIVRVGASPTSAALQRWLAHHDDVMHVVIDDARRWKDHGATATHYVRADACETLGQLAEVNDGGVSIDSEWQALWREAEAATLGAIADSSGPEQEPHEGDVVASVFGALPDGANLFVSSSMPIRDVDAFGHPREGLIRLHANRGASGIDGVVSSAFGMASQSDAPSVCIIGDVAFFHDQNGLLWSREEDAAVVFVLLDNDGGGIFHMLPISEYEPHFTRFFATPHGVDAAHAAAAHSLDFEDVTPDGVGPRVAAALDRGRSAVLRVKTDRIVNHRRHLEVQQAVGRSVTAALG